MTEDTLTGLPIETANYIETLRVELAVAIEARDHYAGLYATHCGTVAMLETELASVRGHAEALTEALIDCAHDLEAGLNAKKTYDTPRKMERDRATIMAANAACAAYRETTK